MEKTERDAIIRLVKREVVPAIGCTEPIAVALSVAKAVEIIEEKCEGCGCPDWRLSADFRIKVEVSGNILKNGMGVGIPGTGMIGLYIAAALGAVCGKSEYGLEVLHDLDPAAISRAKELVDSGRVTVGVAETGHKLYVKTYVKVIDPAAEHESSAVIEDDHDNIVETSLDGHVLHCSQRSCSEEEQESGITGKDITVKEIVSFASETDFRDIRFILESRTMNLALAEEGLQAMENWMNELGLVMNISQLGATEDMIEGIADGTLIMPGGYKVLEHDEIVEILKESLR